MECSNLPFMTWYLCIAFMSFSKKCLSALEMQCQIGHKRYGTVWKLMHKIRKGMGKRDDKYSLDGYLEMDEVYFEHATKTNTPSKRGRGSKGKQNVMVMAESEPLENIEIGAKSSQCRYFKMKCLTPIKKMKLTMLLLNTSTTKLLFFQIIAPVMLILKNLLKHISVKTRQLQ